MSIALLRQIAHQQLPLNVSDLDQVDEVRVLVDAGLIAAFEVRGLRDSPVLRILAITSDGRRLIQRCMAVA